jgi:hypothetical protein
MPLLGARVKITKEARASSSKYIGMVGIVYFQNDFGGCEVRLGKGKASSSVFVYPNEFIVMP